uniref:Galactosylgalactosylxylosylprotein 3-beta-glucuronosyltransferase n=1 Tax=Rhabditophanes sp. KR3021 TaxID=114890 RepID=A0AC35TWV7_9BILA
MKVSFCCFLFLLQIYSIYSSKLLNKPNSKSQTKIFVITPTYRRLTRFADLTAMSNSLRGIENVHWLVIEDGIRKLDGVEKIIKSTEIPYTYLVAKTPPGTPRRGWYQRDVGIGYLVKYRKQLLQNNQHGVVYFGDDDNTYDRRLFTSYIRKVKKVGCWAVGMSSSPIESQKVINGKVVGYNSWYAPDREFALDFAAFAISLHLFVANPQARLTNHPEQYGHSPEPILLKALKLKKSDLEPIGYNSKMNEVLVWHTKTVDITKMFGKREKMDSVFGYAVEL